jgi:magnesium chelatase family protein
VRGALAMALTLMDASAPIKLVLPPGSAEEAALVPGVSIYRARHLLDVVRQFVPPGVEMANEQDPARADGWCRMEPAAPPITRNAA